MSTDTPTGTPTDTAESVHTYSVRLTVEVDSASWKLTYGENPDTDVPGYIRNAAMFLDPLLAALREDWRDDGAPVRLAGERLLTAPGARRSKWGLVLDVTLNPQEWRRAHGVDAASVVGPVVAFALAALRPLREEVDAVLEYLPGGSGRVIGEDSFAAGRFTPARP